jgi:hypothetical protein
MRGLYDRQSPYTTLRQADEAIDLGRDLPCHGLATISGGRAQALALLEDLPSSRTEISRTRRLLERLPTEVSSDHDSVFGWGEDRLRYTETWGHAYRGDDIGTDSAATRAKELYPSEDRRTPAQIELLQALARSRSGDITEAVQRAHTALAGLTRAHRTGMIKELARSVLRPVPPGIKNRADVRDYRDLLASDAITTDGK